MLPLKDVETDIFGESPRDAVGGFWEYLKGM